MFRPELSTGAGCMMRRSLIFGDLPKCSRYVELTLWSASYWYVYQTPNGWFKCIFRDLGQVFCNEEFERV